MLSGCESGLFTIIVQYKSQITSEEGVFSLIIVLDTNVLCRDFYAKGADMKLLFKMANIIIPEVVFDESLNKHKEKLREAGNNIKNKMDEYNRLVNGKIAIDIVGNYDEEDTQYEEFLIGLLIEHGSYPPQEYPNVPHKEVVRRAIERKKPFKANGKGGYRDYLVWRSVLDVVKESSRTMPSEIVHFISENTNDFADVGDKRKLHPDLLQEMEQLQIDSEKLIFWPSLRAFIETIVKPELAKVEAEEKLKQELLENERLLEEVSTYINKYLKGFDISMYDVFVPGEKPVIESVEDDSDWDVCEISKVETDKILVTLSCAFLGIIRSEIMKAEMTSLPQEYFEESFFETVDDKRLVVRTNVPLDVWVEIIFDKNSNSIDAIEIIDVSDSRYCPFCSYD